MKKSMMATVSLREAFRMSLLIFLLGQIKLELLLICLFEGFYSNFPASTLNIFICESLSRHYVCNKVKGWVGEVVCATQWEPRHM